MNLQDRAHLFIATGGAAYPEGMVFAAREYDLGGLVWAVKNLVPFTQRTYGVIGGKGKGGVGHQ